MLMQSATSTEDVSLAQESQKHQSNSARKHVVIDKGKYKIRAIKRKWTEREYHVQENDDVSHKYV